MTSGPVNEGTATPVHEGPCAACGPVVYPATRKPSADREVLARQFCAVEMYTAGKMARAGEAIHVSHMRLLFARAAVRGITLTTGRP